MLYDLKANIFIFLFIRINRFSECYILTCYMTNWSQYRPGIGRFIPDYVDPHLCTHIIYAFAKLSKAELAPYEWNDLSTEWSVGMYEKTTNLKKVNPELKILLAVGGWNLASTEFSNMVNDISSKTKFIVQSVEFLKKHNFDGLDIDWEYPSNRDGSRPSDRYQFTSLLKDLKHAFTAENLILTAALGAGKNTIDSAYEVAQISEYLDFANIMTYDYHGSWETKTGHNTPLFARDDEISSQKDFNVNFTINHYIQNGMPRDKIVLGLATYGRSFTLYDPSKNQIGSQAICAGNSGLYTREAGFIAYYELCKMFEENWTVKRDEQQKISYAFKDTQWVGFDDTQSYADKLNYLKSMNLAGAMIWALDLDDFSGNNCGQGKYPLTNFVKMTLQYYEMEKDMMWTRSTAKTTELTTTTTTTTTTTMTTSIATTSSPELLNEYFNVQNYQPVRRKITRMLSRRVNKCKYGNGLYTDFFSGCRKFYMCFNTGTELFRIQEFECPANKIFDITTSSCDYPYKVICYI